MANFSIPASQPTYEVKLDGLLGVDFSSSFADVDKRRSPNGYNFINNNRTIEKRNGYKSLTQFCTLNPETQEYIPENINGIWNVDTPDGEFIIVHAGTTLWKVKPDWSEASGILTGLADHKSIGIIIDNTLLILDGQRAAIFNLNSSVGLAKFLDENAYIPTTQIARSPDGLQSQAYESVNLLSSYRINLFTSNTTDTTYKVEQPIIHGIVGSVDASTVHVEVLNSNTGEWEAKVKGTDYNVNVLTGDIVFENPVGNPPVDGRDNVRITYKLTDPGTGDNLAQINKCTIVRSYGYNGANNRIFLTGNPDYANIVMYSEIDNISYIPAENVIRLGLEQAPITNLIRLVNGHLAALKNVSDSDSTLFEIGYGMFDGKEVFNVLGSSKGEGNISPYVYDTLLNEPLMLSENGVFAVNSATLSDNLYVNHKSYYIDGKLKEEPNKENAIGIVCDGKYYLALNDHVYVADSRFKSSNINSKNSNYQYEWFYWTNLPVRTWFVWNNKLYFGDTRGNICVFRDDNDPDRFKDKVEYQLSPYETKVEENNVEAMWQSVILDLNSSTRKKNIKRVTIQSNPTDSKLTIGYKILKGIRDVLTKIYTNSTFPKTTVIRKKAKKLSYFSIYVENKENKNMSFDAITVVYSVGSYYKGD